MRTASRRGLKAGAGCVWSRAEYCGARSTIAVRRVAQARAVGVRGVGCKCGCRPELGDERHGACARQQSKLSHPLREREIGQAERRVRNRTELVAWHQHLVRSKCVACPGVVSEVGVTLGCTWRRRRVHGIRVDHIFKISLGVMGLLCMQTWSCKQDSQLALAANCIQSACTLHGILRAAGRRAPSQPMF